MASSLNVTSVLSGFLCGDDQIVSINDTFDVNICAHDTALALVPITYSLLFCFPYLLYLARLRNTNTLEACEMGGASTIFKVLFAFVFLISNLTESIFTLDLVFVSKTSLFHAMFRLLLMTFISLMILLITFLERRKKIPVSICLFLFWLLVLLVTSLRFASGIMQEWYNFFPHKTYFIFVCLVLAISIAQTILYGFVGGRLVNENDVKAKDDILLREDMKLQMSVDYQKSPELTASVLSKLTFWWMTGLILMGWKKPLQPSNIWRMPITEWSVGLIKNFQIAWNYSVKKICNRVDPPLATRRPTVVEIDPVTGQETEALLSRSPADLQPAVKRSSWTLVVTMFRAFGVKFAFAGVLKFMQDFFLLLGPIYMMIITKFMKDAKTRPAWHGYAAVIGLLLNCLLQTSFLQQYFYTVSIVGMRVRAALTTAIYNKSLRLSNASRQKATTGQTVNLMSVDANHFLDTAMFFHVLWSAPLQITIAIVLLWTILGAATFAGLVVMVLTVVFSGFVARLAKKYQFEKMKKKDERIKLTNELLMGIKAIKLYAWEKTFRARIEKARNEEVTYLRRAIFLSCVSATVWSIAPHLVLLATFAAYIFPDPEANLDPVKAFVSIVLFNIMRFPLIVLPNVISNLIQSTVSLKRIGDYLLLEELDESVVSRHQHLPNPNTVISVENGSFAWDHPVTREEEAASKKEEEEEEEEKEKKAGTGEKFALNSIDIDCEEGQLVAIVGEVGAGKSSLLSAILGEMVKLDGTVAVNGSCGYVAQTPWIQNATVRNNILFSAPEDNCHYNQVVDACALRPDLDILAAGDLTEIGEKGINLSGGQKQRIALARAVYANADIYLLDDPLSAVDSYTARHLFDHVIGPGGLLATDHHKKTRIWATHRLNFLPHCDRIILMAEGKIVMQGKFKQLLESSMLFRDLIRSYMQSQEVDNDEALELESALASEIGTSTETPISRQSSVSSGICGDVRKRTRSCVSPTKAEIDEAFEIAKKKKEVEKLIETEEIKEGRVKLTIFSAYAKALGVIFVIIVLLFYMLSHVLSVGAQNYLSIWSDEVVTNSSAALSNKTRNFTVISVLYVSQALAVLIATLTMAVSSIRAAVNLHERLLLSITRTAMIFFESTPIGRIVNRFAKDIDVIDVTLRENVLGFLMCAFHVAATFIIISIKLPIFLAIGLPLLVVYFFVQRIFVASMRQLRRIESVARSPLLSHFSETITGVSTIRAFGKQTMFRKQFMKAVDENQQATYISQMGNRWLSVRMELIGSVVIFSTALFGVIQRDTLDPGAMALALAYAMSVSQTLNWMVRQSSEIETNIVAVERIDEYMDTKKEGDWSVPSVDKSKLLRHWPRTGEIVFDNVVLRYREGLEPALRGLSFTVKPREKVGIVGRTGAGKSSLSTALLRIVELDSGKITIDGVDLKDIGIHVLRRAVTPIPQDSTLFSGTLRFNLDPFNKHTSEELLHVLGLVNMRTFVDADPKGLDLNVAENGDNLSAGQRQLVCMARALLRRPSPKPHDGLEHRWANILLMDEATAAVDVNTDRLITEMVRTEFKDSTVLTIAHRLDTVIDYDRILVLAQGQVLEFDTPATLLADTSSEFYKMAKSAGLVK